jgi:hypothetical protein
MNGWSSNSIPIPLAPVYQHQSYDSGRLVQNLNSRIVMVGDLLLFILNRKRAMLIIFYRQLFLEKNRVRTPLLIRRLVAKFTC